MRKNQPRETRFEQVLAVLPTEGGLPIEVIASKIRMNTSCARKYLKLLFAEGRVDRRQECLRGTLWRWMYWRKEDATTQQG